MKHWQVDKDKTLKQCHKLVPIHRLKTPYKLLVSMLCCLYMEEKRTHFQNDQLPLAHTIIRTRQIFNWEDILVFNICLHANNLPGIKKPCFYMLAYMINAICSSVQFPNLGWNWNQNQPSIHVYFSQLWSVNYIKHFYNICYLFLTPLQSILFGFPRHRISFEARNGMKGVANQIFYKYYSYIRVYETTRSSHLLPYFVL